MRTRGFSLLEVMVSIAILGISLTVILSAQGGLAASNRSAEAMGVASNLARCKMTEVEEKLIKFGYQELDERETDVACCAGDSDDRYICDYKVEKVELPAPPTGGADAGLDFQSLLGGADGGAPGSSLDLDGGLQGLGSQLGGANGGAGASGMLSMVMGIVYPSLKPVMEASIRRVTVTVRWKEGPNAKELPIVQFVTNPQRGGFVAGSADDGGGLPNGSSLDGGFK